jgi:hypothetical protein
MFGNYGIKNIIFNSSYLPPCSSSFWQDIGPPSQFGNYGPQNNNNNGGPPNSNNYGAENNVPTG